MRVGIGLVDGRRPATVLLLTLALLSSACTPPPPPPGGPTTTVRTGLEATRSLSTPRQRTRRQGIFDRASRPTPTEVTLSSGSRADAAPLFTDQGETVTLNLVDVPIRTAANAIFTEILHANYVLGDDVSGTVTLQTSKPVSKQALVDSFQSVLAAKGLSIVETGGIYRISAGQDPMQTGSLSFGNGRDVQVGNGARIVPLQSISAAEMQRILAPIAPSGVLRADTARNVLVLTGTAEQIRSMQEAIALFDVDWMRGQSAAIFPLQSGGDAVAITKQLEALFSTDGGPGEGAVRFVPSRELNSILVIAANQRHLARVRDYIAKLDYVASANTTQNFVYKVENRPAKELATIVQGMMASEGASGVASGLSAIRSTVGLSGEAAGSASLDAATPEDAAEATPTAAGKMIVVADEPNNALIVVATKAQYDRLLPILVASDKMANQVLIEAVIAEVTLNDQLKFGLRWFFENNGGKGKGRLSDAANGAIAAVAPGFSYFFSDVNFQVVLNALASITNVKVISSPTLTVLDNRTARLQIGDQVPVVTQTASATSASIDAPIVNKVEMKDTGVILSVTPRVNSNGHVLLNIEQEVSDVVRTTSSGIDSPTIRQRKVATTVVVSDGQSIALGGLVQESREKGNESVPVLGNVPVLGAAFRNRSDVKKRTELVIFIRPRVMRNGSEAEAVTREFREGLARLGLEDRDPTTIQRIVR
ncbi:type II secretion system secretin GspD [Aureimonas pseudogalii]|uniref:General secretion pathway protein D n=1 Tax=Aureimonas pseudogalii TaxID=1744844 RepID=A0A7W6H3D3_9HYPH|nr:type II secretion system secretin GspD [Aureimonas pseudogalii]MBB3997052.1 general secretion pathway protein D [Aureimonas pseudogalii]